MSESVIVAGAATSGGALCASLGALPSVTLGALVIEAALDRAGIGAADVDHVLVGQRQARQVVRRALVPDRVPAVSVGGTRFCALRTLALADRLIRGGEGDVVVVSGTDPGLARTGTGPPWRVERAVAVVLMRRTRAERLGLPWLAGLGAHSTVVGSAGSSYAQAVRAVRQALRETSAVPRDLCAVDVRESPRAARGYDAVPDEHVFDTTGLRMALRLSRSLRRRERGTGAVAMWGDHGAEAVVICADRI
ncbi:hypothetical protein ACFVYR_03715 [Streptomyces sp. NPDC058284]|uniref:thiolase family protein n=1 Tax=unclassified Streptomyces TaxID=2593676 RepID=UPI003662B80E